jgi:uncharacterized phage-associated protein
MSRDVREVGNAILDAAERAGFRLSNMALNKIIYFAHGWFLAQYGEPLVNSPFEAWQFGPVHPQVYRQLRRFKEQPIVGRLTRIDMENGGERPFEVCLPDRELDLVDRVAVFYGRYPASKLVQISHEVGAPWDQIWSLGEGQPCPGMVIPDDVTESFYRMKLARSS